MSKIFNTSRLLRGSAYGILGIPMLILWASIFAPLVSTSVSLMIIGVGFILLSITLRAAGLAGIVERWILTETFGIEIVKPQRTKTGSSVRSVLLDPLRDGSYWRELAFVGVRSILGSVAAVIVIVTWAFPVFSFSTIFWGWSTSWDFGVLVLILLLGVATIVVGPLLISLITELQIAVAHSLLGLGHRELVQRADTAQRHRDLSVEGAEAERRRIERDLHDGAQARLATVAMDLGRAKRKLERQGGDAEVTAIIDSAHHDAKAAIVELRNLARGIHPAVLTDRGLDAALSDLAARCTVPVHLDVQLAIRPAAHIESAAYFAVSELLANISKHSNATSAWVTVRSDDKELRMDVSDDGLGGVDPSIGSGIRGLHDRIASIDGTFTVTSPLAGGTSAIVEIPLTKASG
jgi:signal transduction histidine kinase